MKPLNSFVSKGVIAFAILFLTTNTASAQRPDLNTLLKQGKIKQAESEFTKLLDKDANDELARFSLAATQMLRAVETIGQSFHKYGLREPSGIMPILRLPVPKNDDPAPVTYQQFRKIIEQFSSDIAKADATFSRLESTKVALVLNLAEINVDWENDGVDPIDSLMDVIQHIFTRGRVLPNDTIRFDRADVHWFRGYCNLLQAMCNFFLAYDHQTCWDSSARMFFENAKSKFDFLEEEAAQGVHYWGIPDIAACIHNMNFKILEPQRMKAARNHLLTTIQQSRKMCEALSLEVDNDREWIPNSNQTSSVTRTRITERMFESWIKFLDEAEKILKGEMLIPFWRGTDKKRGFNLHRFFEDPRDFDLVLYIHGTGASPFVEKGNVSSPATWREFQRVFRGDFFGFAAWIN